MSVVKKADEHKSSLTSLPAQKSRDVEEIIKIISVVEGEKIKDEETKRDL